MQTCVINYEFQSYGVRCMMTLNSAGSDRLTDAGYYVEYVYNWVAPCGGGNYIGQAVCNAGYYWNDTAKVCTPICQRQSDCDDQNVCNGVESCGADGGCQKGTALTCDDNNKCTNDACKPDAGCVNTPLACLDGGSACSTITCDPMVGQCVTNVDATACMCSAVNLPPIQASAELAANLGSIPCEGIGGQFGVSAKIKATGSVTAASCANNCVDTADLSARADVSFGLCNFNDDAGFTVTGQGNYTVSGQHAQQCDPATCSSGCSTGHCATETGTGSVSAKISRGFGRQFNKSFLGGGASVRCGASASLSGTFTMSDKTVTDRADPSGTCVGCDTLSASVSAGTGVQADCVVGLSFRGDSAELGCKNCATFDVKLTGGASGTTGACGGQRCVSLRSDLSGAAQLPTMTFKRKWWEVKGACGVSVAACSELSSCGACSCKNCQQLDPRMSCSVCSGLSQLSFCGQQP